jgi:hypothetical protein
MLINTLTAKERKKGEGPLSLSLSLFEGTTKPPQAPTPAERKGKKHSKTCPFIDQMDVTKNKI